MKRIDLGSGGGKRPAPGYDIYTDINIPKKPPANFVHCALESMPMFADKEFDFARARHCIEHVVDPDKACSEIIRIAKAGVISFPSPQAEMMHGIPEHNWYVFLEEPPKRQKRLLFIRKWHSSFDKTQIRDRSGDWIPLIGHKDAKSYTAQTQVNFEWEGSFNWVVYDVPEPIRMFDWEDYKLIEKLGKYYIEHENLYESIDDDDDDDSGDDPWEQREIDDINDALGHNRF